MILLEENGKTSSSRRTQHLDIQYFLFKPMRDKNLNLPGRAGADVHRSVLERNKIAATEAEGKNNGIKANL